jgi:hypothetical protein
MLKRIAMTAAAALLAAPALAYTGVSPSLLEQADLTLDREGFETVDVTSLTDRQVVDIYLIGTQSYDDPNERIEAVLRGEGLEAAYSANAPTLAAEGYVLVEEEPNAVAFTVQNFLERNGLDMDPTILTDDQVAQIYLIAFSGSETNSEKVEQIEQILGM